MITFIQYTVLVIEDCEQHRTYLKYSLAGDRVSLQVMVVDISVEL
jgi:hypothetical protein